MHKNGGQITVLVLLLAMLGLMTGLSVASRSLSDLKQATYVDSGTKALAAAEAGLQYALASAQLTGSGDSCSEEQPVPVSFSGIKTGGLTYRICGVVRDSLTIPNVAKDDVFEVDLSGVNSNVKAFDVSWKGDASVEIEVVDSDDTIRRYLYNAATSLGQSRGSENGFADAVAGSVCAAGTDSQGRALCDTTFASGSCTGYGEICRKPDCSGGGGVAAQLIRIKPLYQDSALTVCGRAAGNSQVGFGLQYYQVIATATTLNNSVKKIQADYFPAALPAIFDNILYSEGNINK